MQAGQCSQMLPLAEPSSGLEASWGQNLFKQVLIGGISLLSPGLLQKLVGLQGLLLPCLLGPKQQLERALDVSLVETCRMFYIPKRLNMRTLQALLSIRCLSCTADSEELKL